MARCDECGFDWEMDRADVITAIGRFGSAYRAGLTRFLAGENGDALIRHRPAPQVWSALEYAAHMRDVVTFYGRRIERVLAEHRPPMAAADFSSLAEERQYAAERVERVIDALAGGSAAVVDRLDGLTPEQWERVGIGSEGGERTVLVLARRLAHEGHHHLLDVGRVLRTVREQGPPSTPERA